MVISSSLPSNTLISFRSLYNYRLSSIINHLHSIQYTYKSLFSFQLLCDQILLLMNAHDQSISGRRTRPRAHSSTTMPANDNLPQSSIVTTLEDRDSKRRKVDDLDLDLGKSDSAEGLLDKNTEKNMSFTTQDEQPEVPGETQMDLNVSSSSSAPQFKFPTSASSINVKPSQTPDTIASSSGTTTSTPASISPSEDPLFSPRARAQELISRVSLELEQDNAHLPRMDYVDPFPVSPLFNAPSSGPRVELPSEPLRDQQEPSIELSSSTPPSSEDSQRPAPQNVQPSTPPTQRIPTGTSLIVQGLVQTVARPRSNNPPHHRAHSSASPSGSRSFFNRHIGHGSGQVPVSGTRRSADRSATGTAQQNERPEDDDDGIPSFEEQASLIGGLLSMATTATARSLLSTTSEINVNHSPDMSSVLPDPTRIDTPNEPSRQPPAQSSNRLPSRFASVVDGFQRRLNALRNVTSNSSSSISRPHVAPRQSLNTGTSQTSSNTPSQEEGIERVLRRFMTEAFERQGDSGPAPARSPLVGARPEAAEEDDTDGASVGSDRRLFETFLSGLQPSLVEALMAFDENSLERETGESRTEGADGERGMPVTEDQTDTRGTETAARDPVNGANSHLPEEQAEGGRRMNWMRVHRFSPRLAPASRANGASLDGTSNPSSFVSVPTAADEGVNGTESAHVSESGPSSQDDNATSERSASNVLGERTVIPLIMVGVRSVRPRDVPSIFASTTSNGGQPSATTATPQRNTSLRSNSSSAQLSRQEMRADRSRSSSNTLLNPTRSRSSPYASSLPARFLRDRSLQVAPASSTPGNNEDTITSNESLGHRSTTSHTRPSGFALLRRALSGIIGNGSAPASAPDHFSSSSSQSTESSNEPSGGATSAETTATTSDTSLETTDTVDDTEIRRSNSFILWVIGGLYAPDHPILTAPGLFTGHLDHDDLWALAELLGQAKPPTATASEINSSGLTIVHGLEITSLVKQGHIHPNTSDRCAVCLEDYTDEVECRIMSCKHVFHKECIDKWLNVGRNACPACRTKGVKVKADEQDPSVASSSASENIVSLDA